MPTRKKFRRKKSRLTRREWLAGALDLLAREGGANLHIASLCRELGVTRGSFYWHFASRDEFIDALVEYWDWVFTSAAAEQQRGAQGSAEERLLAFMRLLRDGRFARFDLAVRAWAAQEPRTSLQIAHVDEERLQLVRSLFSDLGFRGREREMRARVFVVYQSMERGLQSRLSDAEEEKHLLLRHAFFVKR